MPARTVNKRLRLQEAAREQKNAREWRRLEAQQAIGQRVRRLRLKKGFTQEEFADRCAIDRAHMSRIERGETNLAFSTLYTLTYFLDITIYELLRGIL